MYDPKIHATTDKERFALPNETIFDHVYRVYESYRADPGRGQLTFVDLPADFKREYPEVFGRFSDESLGIIFSLVWLYLKGAKGTVNDRVIRKWFREAIGEGPVRDAAGGTTV
ncbi:MAG TPA: hypothetical protein VD997_03975 [Phycisphaerales bacterium]|nr:hypothetical protein [Phycisphaerales bacterium]